MMGEPVYAKPKEHSTYPEGALLTSLVFLVAVSSTIGFLGSLLILAPDTVFGVNRWSASFIVALLAIAGALEVCAINYFSRVLYRYSTSI